MATVVGARDVASRSQPDPRRPVRAGTRSRRATQVAVGCGGLGMTLIVLDGSWSWAVVRVLLVGAVVSRVMHAIDHRSRRFAAIGLTVFGLVVASAGGAISVSYLSTGWNVRAVGGVIASLGGIAAFVVGIVLVVRSAHGWWRRLLCVLVVLVAGYAVAFPVVMSVYATNVGRPELGNETPADRGLTYVDASFTTTDGVTLSGWYVPSTNGAAIVLLHGASSTRTSVLDEAVVLARHGYGVLLYDARGMGRSSGRAMDFGWYGDRDVQAAVTYVLTRPDVDSARIGALGESMGGEEAIGAMASDGRIKAVVAEGATNRVIGDWDWLSDSYGLRGFAQRGVHWLTYQLTDLFTDASPPITLRVAVAQAAPRPVLLVAAGNVSDETQADLDVQRAAPSSVDVWVVPGANHVGGLSAQPAEWEQRVTSFLDRNLAPESRR